MNSALGRYLFGLALAGTGVCSLVWHEAPNHAILTFLVGSGAAQAFIYASASIQVAAGIALVAIEPIVRHPLVYNSYGNFFEQLSLLAGALILYAGSGSSTARMTRL